MHDLLKFGNGYKTAFGIMLYVAGSLAGAQGNVDLMANLHQWGILVGLVGVAHKAVKMK